MTQKLIINKDNLLKNTDIKMTENISDNITNIIRYIGDDPKREGLKETPDRVIKSYKEIFSGYNQDVSQILNKKFYEVNNYDDMVSLRNISFTSMCEHHMLPFVGEVTFAYIPNGFVVGISKIARLVEALSKRMQIQERMTKEIGETFNKYANPRGVAIKVSSAHYCMIMRGVKQKDASMESFYFSGEFKTDKDLKNRFLNIVN